jgi:hypothetical protein
MKKINDNRGFIRTIILIIIILVTAKFFGINVDAIWNNFLGPIVFFIWDAILWIANFLHNLLKFGLDSFYFVTDKLSR